MTKAEATVYNSPLWKRGEQRVEDHGSLADTSANIYHRFIKGNPVPSHRLVCYSSHGDSILWVKGYDNVNWTWYRDSSIRDGNIEYEYDRVLPPLV